MARARNVKPGLFKNEILGVADPLFTLLFEGLWLLADRAGRLEDRPLRIKAEVFPYRDGISVDDMLTWLQANGFITRYEAKGVRVIQIVNFEKHQNPHKNEAPSELPCHTQCDGSPSEGFGAASEEIGSARADSLSTDSLSTDSLYRPSVSSPAVAADSEPAGRLPACPHRKLLDLFAEKVPELPRPKPELWSGKNATAMQARWKWLLTATRENGERYATTEAEAFAWFGRFFERVQVSDFLTGRDDAWTGCSLGWLMKAENFAKVVSGNYVNRSPA